MGEPEHIPDEDHLYRRVHPMYFQNGNLAPGAFNPAGSSISVNWDRYSTPEDTRALSQSKRITAKSYTVARINTGETRNLTDPPQIVEHSPSKNNPAHTDVKGESSLEIRIEFTRIAEIILHGE